MRQSPGAGYFPRGDGRVWLIDAADVATANRMSNGSYDAWDCLNAHFGKVHLTHIGSTSTAFRLELEGRLPNEIVRALYAALPSVTSVYFGGPGSGPTICATDEGTRMVYAINQASGDCPAGCTTHDWWLVTSTAPGVVTLAGHQPDGGGPAPDWLHPLWMPLTVRGGLAEESLQALGSRRWLAHHVPEGEHLELLLAHPVEQVVLRLSQQEAANTHEGC